MKCPLCNTECFKKSYLGRIFFKNHNFDFLECGYCGSLFCYPMPNEELLSLMYSSEYRQRFTDNPAIADPEGFHRVIKWLRKKKPGTFLDFGCGSGLLLKEALKLNWQAIGVEFDTEVALAVQKDVGVDVFNQFTVNQLKGPVADILHLGDVIEHLTDLNKQMPKIMGLLKPNGILLAQGPLENNANLFTFIVRSLHKFKRGKNEIVPYHILLATSFGQRTFFKRHGLKELEFRISEISWPAPKKFHISYIKDFRSLSLFLLRRLSQLISVLRPNVLGNRYFYAGFNVL